MADAAINVVVRGQAELDRVIGKINQLDGLIQSVRSTPLDLSAGKSESRILDLSASVSGYESKLKSVKGQLKSLDDAVDNYIDQIKKQQDAQRSLTAGTAAYSNIQQKIEKNQRALSVAHASLAVKAEEEERILRKLAATRKELGKAQGVDRQISFLNELADSYVRLGDARRITKTGFSAAAGDNALAGNRITNAQLKAQVALLKQVADNVELGSQKYREFTIAADVASRKVAASARSSFNILAEAYSAEAPQTNFGRILGAKDIAGARKQVNDLVSAFAKIAPSEAGLGAYRAELESLRSVVPIASAEFNRLSAAIEEVDKALAKARPMAAVPETRQGPAIELGSVQASREQLKYDKAILEARQKLLRVSVEIDGILTSEKEKARLREQVGEGFLALDEGRLEVAQKIARATQADARISRRDFKDKQIQSDRGIKLQNKIIEKSKEAEAAVKKLEAMQAGAYDNSDLADFLETQKQIGAEYASQNKAGDKAGRLWRQQLDSAAALPDQLRKLQTIQNNYNRAKEKGAKFSQQEEELLSKTIAKLSDPAFTAKAGTQKAVGDVIKQFESIRRLRISEIPTSARGAGGATPARLEERRSRLLENAFKLQGQIQTLEDKGANVANERLSLERQILQIKNLQGKATQSEIEILASGLQDIRTNVQGAKTALQEVVSAEGFAASFQKLKTSLATSRGFFEGTDPRTAINDIYKQFAKAPSSATSSPAQQASENIVKTFADALKSGGSRAAAAATVFSQSATKAIKKVFGIASPSRFMIEIVKTLADTYVAEMQRQYPRIQAATDKAFGEQTLLRNVKELRATDRGFEFVERPSRGFRPFREAQGFGRGTEGATQEFNNMMLNFRKQIAELTTQPEIFSNLLRGLPDDRITTDLIGAANRRALASELPSFMSTQRMLGPGELEKAITSAFSKFVRELRVPASERIRSERFAGPKLLPPATEIITPSQQERIVRAYERSAQRALSVLTEDAFRGIGRQSLPAANFGFMADPARLARLSPLLGNRLLPPAIDVTANAVDGAASTADQGRNRLREAVSGLFSRLQEAISGAAGGIGGGFFGGRGGGGGGTPPMPPGDGGDDAIPPNIRNLSINQLELFAGSLAEVRAQLDPTAAGFDRLDRELRDLIGSVQREQQRRDPNADFLTRRFGPRSATAISEGLIGGAFPLLFGQGLGASIGGGIGGGLGGFAGGGLGFGLSLIGTALGTALDTLGQSAKDTGSALNYPIEGFQKLKDAGLMAGRQQEYYISKLIEAGRAAEATAEIQSQIVKKIGVSGVKDLMQLDDASSKLSKAWADLNLQMQVAVAGPLAGLLGWIENVVRLSTATVQQQAMSLDPAAFEKARSEAARIASPFGIIGDKARYEAELNRRSAEIVAANQAKIKLPTPKPDPAQQEADLRKQMQIAQEIRSLQQQGADIQRSGAELRLSIEDTIYGLRRRAEDMARESIEFRRSVEDEIFNKRQGLEQKLIENERKRQQNAIDALDLQLQRASTELDPVAQGVVDAARQYLRIRAEGEADLQQTEQQVKLELQRIDQETSRYKLQTEDRIAQMVTQREEFARDVSRARTQAEYQVQDYIIKVEQYRVEMAQRRVELALQEADGIARATQIAAGAGLFDGTPGNVVGGAVGLQQAIERIRGAYSFRGTSLAKNKRPGDYQSDPRENFFFDFQPRSVIDAAKKRVASLTDRDIAALALTVLTEAGPTNVGKMDVAANLITRSAMKGGAPISAIATAPGQYEGVFKRNLRPSQLEDPAFGRRMFGAAYDRVFSMFSGGGASTPGSSGSWFSIPAGFPGAQAPVDRYGLTVGAQAAPTSQSASAAPGIGTFVGGGSASIASAQIAARDMSMQVPPTPPAMPQWPTAPALVGINDLMEKYIELQAKLKTAIESTTGIERRRLQIQSEAARLAFEQQTLAPLRQFKEQNRELEFEIQKRKLRNRLLTEGVKPEIVDGELRVLEINRNLVSVLDGLEATTNEAVAAELRRLGLNDKLVDSTFRLTEATLAGLIATTEDIKKQDELRARLQSILDLRNQLADGAGAEADAAVSGARGIAAEEAMPGQRLQEFIAEATTELNDLEAVALSVSQGIGNAVGSSIANGISGLVQGTATAKEVFANFLTDVGQLLVQEGTKMIATYVAIGIARIFAGLGSTTGAAGPNPGGIPSTGNVTAPSVGGFDIGSIGNLAANGAYFANGIAAFAMGGAFTNSIVSSPTLFQFANGGTLSTGVMGEAGPEAIMPLERGPDGRLGVRASLSVPFEGGSVMPDEELDSESSQSDTTRMRRLAAAAASSLRIPFSRVDGAGAGAVGAGFAGAAPSAAPSPATPFVASGSSATAAPEALVETVIRFESTVINGVEFVTRQEAEQIGRTAAARGADLAQRRLKNNPQARRSIGI